MESRSFLSSEQLIGIGALGNMLSPSALHLNNTRAAYFLRILDRGKPGDILNKRRQDWLNHGAQLVENLIELIGDGEFDGIVICAGKNGDDYKIFIDLIPLLNNIKSNSTYFILHFSTVSKSFVTATNDYCMRANIQYVNYPLTGGAHGAISGKMLILASGSLTLYNKVLPLLQSIGNPRYFDDNIAHAAIVKLIGHILVFNGLFGISTAALIHKKTVALDSIIGEEHVNFFDFLNNGAGGTRQWDVTLKQAMADNNWTNGFLIRHAIVDLIYTLEMMMDEDIPLILFQPIIYVGFLFVYILQEKKIIT